MDTIFDLLDRALADHRQRPALIIKPGFRTRIWTYADIGDQVPRVAQVLRGAGVQPGDRVLIWAVNRPEWGIAFLGALWAEAVPVPVDVRSTDELATKLAAQTEVKLVATKLLQRLRPEALPGRTMTIRQMPTLSPRGGLRMRITDGHFRLRNPARMRTEHYRTRFGCAVSIGHRCVR